MGGARVLVVFEEPAAGQLRSCLSKQGYDVTVASSGEEAVFRAERRLPDVVLLDLDLSDNSSLDVCRRLRGWSCVPIVALAAARDELDKVRVLESGADDYITKPFGAGELGARIRVALRHAAGANLRPEVLLGEGDLRVDFQARKVWRDGQEIRLTPREYDVLKVLVQQRDRDLRYWEVLRAVWGTRFGGDGRSRRRYIPRLRRKIERDPAHPRYLLCNRGSGCRLRS
jgi:two-component system, OmpR family, KDP operon response regulator KdpE